jgi:membrane protein implicated in regulation of membrane protease activity
MNGSTVKVCAILLILTGGLLLYMLIQVTIASAVGSLSSLPLKVSCVAASPSSVALLSQTFRSLKRRCC